MSNQEEEPPSKNDSTTYQFFSNDLNYTFFTEQSASVAAPNTVNDPSSNLNGGSLYPTAPALSSFTDFGYQPSSLVIPPSTVSLPAPELSPSLTSDFGQATYSSNVDILNSGETALSQISAPAPVEVARRTTFPTSLFETEDVPTIVEERVEYSLNNDEVEPTFEERVAAMKQQQRQLPPENIPAPNYLKVSPSNESQYAQIEAATKPNDVRVAAPAHQPTQLAQPTVPQYMQSAPSFEQPDLQVNTAQVEDEWHRYIEPNVIPDVFSSEFNFNRSLLKIFWRIDVDHNNRVSKCELALAIAENWFAGDERLLAKLLFEAYEDISPETVFCDAGLSVNNICSYGPFAQMSVETIPYSQPIEAAPVRKPAPAGNNKKSSQSLRSLFRGR